MRYLSADIGKLSVEERAKERAKALNPAAPHSDGAFAPVLRRKRALGRVGGWAIALNIVMYFLLSI